MAELQRGVVKWFNDAKGFGFIEHSSGRDIFVHYSIIESEGFKTLKDGEEVEYELREGDKGLNASRVIRVNAPKVAEKKDDSTAPNLEAGTVSTSAKPVSSMIEMEKDSNKDGDAHAAMAGAIAASTKDSNVDH